MLLIRLSFSYYLATVKQASVDFLCHALWNLFIIFLFKNSVDLIIENPMNGRVVLTEIELNSSGEK